MTAAIRTTAPEPLEPLPFNIGKPFTTTLDNGLKVVLFTEKRLPLVSFRLAFLSGDAADPAASVGVTSAVASMLTEGTANYSSKELAEKVERLGASLSANSSEDFFVISGSALSIYSSDILQLMAEVLFRATFPEAELDLYKRNGIENLKFQRSQPGFLANEQVARIIYGEHPYAKISPTADDVEKLSREQLTEFYSKQLIPNNAVLIAVGDIDKDEFLTELDTQLGGWNSGSLPEASLPEPPHRDGRTLTIVDRPGSAQSNIVLANLAFPRSNPDYFAAIVMNQILGAGASSRVFMNLREEKGYTYGAYTRLDTKRLAGDFEATAEVRTQVTGDSLREFFYELERIRNEAASEQELADAKNFLTGVFPIRAETQEGLTNLIVNQQLYDLPEDYLQTYRENVNAITIEDVQRVAKKYIHPDSLAMIIVGDAAEVLPQVRSYSDDISVFDTEGRPMNNVDYEAAAAAEAVDVAGSWDLNLDFQGQKVPVKLVLEKNGESVSGTIDTALGSGLIEDGSVNGNRFNATATTEIQGQSVELVVNGVVDAGTMKGTISTAVIPGSLPFEGTRKN
jgi:zinc protease